MLDDKTMNEIIEKCLKDPEFKKIFDLFLKTGEEAAKIGMSVQEMASICMMGYAIGEDPKLQEMVKNISKISGLGLDIVDK